MPFFAGLLITLLSSVSFLTQLERVTGSSVAGNFKKLGEMESVPAPGPLTPGSTVKTASAEM